MTQYKVVKKENNAYIPVKEHLSREDAIAHCEDNKLDYAFIEQDANLEEY